MFRRLAFSLLATLSCGCGGCAMSNIAVQPLETGIQPGKPSEQPVPVYDLATGRPPRAVVPFAALGAHGNGYATRESLKKDLGIRGGRMGADCVVVGNQQVNNAGSVTSYGSGLAISSPVVTLSVFGHACMWSPVRMGLQWDPENKILDIVPNSPADRAGLQIGDRVLAIDNERVTGDPLASYRALARARPGDVLSIELAGPDNQRRIAKVTVEKN